MEEREPRGEKDRLWITFGGISQEPMALEQAKGQTETQTEQAGGRQGCTDVEQQKNDSGFVQRQVHLLKYMQRRYYVYQVFLLFPF
mmetsp:Transcript_7363/g.14651  ORF Transcript_7363/g.14651 Transcript_7363/m.14651 type:complete len:86 (+) Transcript_7363:411-668(+)